MKKTFVGFGFGPIQAGLFLLEAQRSGNFGRLVVAEVDRPVVSAVRRHGGRYTINIAHADRIETVSVGPVEIYDPHDPADHAALVAAVAQADELATALPSAESCSAGGMASVVTILADGLQRRSPGRPAILYAAENHTRAAEILYEKITQLVPPEACAHFQCLNTVIGKMSGVISDPHSDVTIEGLPIATLTPDTPRAVLVEEFNRILISRVSLTGFRRGLTVFEEKDDLRPFAETKLYGHNAVHALIGYLAALQGAKTIATATTHPGIMATARAAFIEESGTALVRKHASLNDPLFTPEGFHAYADDLLARMVNPYLHDLVARVIRDPARKLGYDDRLIGAMRLALAQGLTPRYLAKGAAAAILHLLTTCNAPPMKREELTRESMGRVLHRIWGRPVDRADDELISLVWHALQML